MLTEDANRALTEVGPGTRMGALLRRYWMPIAACTELDDNPVKAVRLLGEDLVLFRDREGRALLVHACKRSRSGRAVQSVRDGRLG